MPTVGTLTIDLTANTASFQGDLGKANQIAKGSANEIKDSFDKMGKGVDYSMMEARHSVMLLGEGMGVHIPRAVSSLIASVAPLGPLLEAAFPILGAVALIGILIKIVEKQEAYKEALRQNAIEVNDLSIKELDRTQGLELQNMKLEDQLNKLSGKPEKNHLAEMLLEAKLKADELIGSLAGVIQKSDDALAKQTGFMSELGRNWEVLKADLASGDINRILTTQAKDALNAQIENVQEAVKKVNEAQLKHAEVDPNNQAAMKQSLEDQAVAYNNLHKAAKEALGLVQEYAPKDVELIKEFTKEATAGASGVNDMGAAIKNLDLSVQVGKGTDDKAAIDKVNKIKEATIAGNKEMQDAEVQRVFSAIALANQEKMEVIDAALATAKKKHEIDTTDRQAKLDLLAQITQDEVDASDHRYNNDVDAHQKKLALLKQEPAQNAAAIVTANAQIEAMATKHEAELTAIKKKGVEARNKAEQEFVNEDYAIQQQQEKLSAKLAEEDLRHFLEMSKLKLKAADEDAQRQYDLGKITAQKLLQLELDHENQMYNIDKAALDKKIADLDKNDPDYPLNKKKVYDEEEKLLQEHLIKEETLQTNYDKKRLDDTKHIVDGITKVFNAGLMSWMNGQESFGRAMAKSWANIASSAIENLIKLAEQELIGLAIHKNIADQKKLTDAKSTFHGTYAALSSIPIIGPIVAPVAAAAAFAAVMAFEQGGLVPKDALAMVHKNEMVLPADLSSGIQAMIKERGRESHPQLGMSRNPGMIEPHILAALAKNRQPVNVHMNVNTPDANSFRKSHAQIMNDGFREASRSASRHGSYGDN